MHGDDDKDLSARYGVWPMLAGAVFAGALIWFMFALADGFA